MNTDLTQTSLYDDIPEILRNSTDEQCRCALVFYNPITKKSKFCALGTIYHKFENSKWRLLLGSGKHNEIKKELRGKHKIKVKCPECGARCDFLFLIIHLNDAHKLTFKQIADRLEITKEYDKKTPLLRKIIDIARALP